MTMTIKQTTNYYRNQYADTYISNLHYINFNNEYYLVPFMSDWFDFSIPVSDNTLNTLGTFGFVRYIDSSEFVYLTTQLFP